MNTIFDPEEITLADIMEELRAMRREISALKPPCITIADNDERLLTPDAAKFMGYRSRHSFACAARAAGVYPLGNRKRFEWSKAALIRWQQSPKYQELRVFTTSYKAKPRGRNGGRKAAKP